ncbi:hypothetical protein LCGC14_1871710 [marine sediment metagenome]|uniref:Uncharacterized protein n=1 Tax=marine sediment metagenome TaxID=412755 RepID=A0A0F9G4W0_9ZZZZ
MAESDKVKTTIYMTPETWDRLILYIRDKYGRDTKATSITIEEAVKEFLEARVTA